MTFTKEELQFMYDIMDQVAVRGEVAKAMVLQIMVKIATEAKNGQTQERLEQVTDEAGV